MVDERLFCLDCRFGEFEKVIGWLCLECVVWFLVNLGCGLVFLLFGFWLLFNFFGWVKGLINVGEVGVIGFRGVLFGGILG